MAYSARVLLDSVSPAGVRLTTLEVTFPRFVLAEFNTHRVLSRNSASSRAVPTSKLIERVERDPAIPLEWGRNKAGMSASDVLTRRRSRSRARALAASARRRGRARAASCSTLNVHKQELNRLLEPFLWHTVIVTATEWENFFELRCAPNAQPEIREAALRMRDAIDASRPGRVGLRTMAHAAAARRTRRSRPRDAQANLGGALRARFVPNPRRQARDREGPRALRTAQERSPLEPVRARRDAGARTRISTRTFAAGFRCAAEVEGRTETRSRARASNAAQVGSLIANQSGSRVLRPSAYSRHSLCTSSPGAYVAGRGRWNGKLWRMQFEGVERRRDDAEKSYGGPQIDPSRERMTAQTRMLARKSCLAPQTGSTVSTARRARLQRAFWRVRRGVAKTSSAGSAKQSSS